LDRTRIYVFREFRKDKSWSHSVYNKIQERNKQV
jgi:hypothetical protein